MYELYKCFHWLEEYFGKHITDNSDIIIYPSFFLREAISTSGSCEYFWKEQVLREAGSSCGSVGMFSKAEI